MYIKIDFYTRKVTAHWRIYKCDRRALKIQGTADAMVWKCENCVVYSEIYRWFSDFWN